MDVVRINIMTSLKLYTLFTFISILHRQLLLLNSSFLQRIEHSFQYTNPQSYSVQTTVFFVKGMLKRHVIMSGIQLSSAEMYKPFHSGTMWLE